MIVLFQDHDLASFGSYLLSEERESNNLKAYNPNNGVTKEQHVRTVSANDLQVWMILEDAKHKPQV